MKSFLRMGSGKIYGDFRSEHTCMASGAISFVHHAVNSFQFRLTRVGYSLEKLPNEHGVKECQVSTLNMRCFHLVVKQLETGLKRTLDVGFTLRAALLVCPCVDAQFAVMKSHNSFNCWGDGRTLSLIRNTNKLLCRP